MHDNFVNQFYKRNFSDLQTAVSNRVRSSEVLLAKDWGVVQNELNFVNY